MESLFLTLIICLFDEATICNNITAINILVAAARTDGEKCSLGEMGDLPMLCKIEKQHTHLDK